MDHIYRLPTGYADRHAVYPFLRTVDAVHDASAYKPPGSDIVIVGGTSDSIAVWQRVFKIKPRK